MWAITPTLAIVFAYLSWAVFCLARIWFFPLRPARFGFIAAALALVIRRAFFTIYAFLGLFLLDIMARFCFLGLISYGSFRYVAASVLLCTTVGILYIFRSVFLSPTRKELLAFTGMAGAYLYMSAVAPVPELRVSLFLGLGLSLLLTFTEILETGVRRRREWKRWRAGEKDKQGVRNETPEGGILFAPPVWDLSRKFSIFAGAKMYIILLILLSAELVLEVEGFSLLCWL